MAAKAYAFKWKDVIALLRSESIDTVIHVAVVDILPPLEFGMCRIQSTTADQRPEFGLVVDERIGCHVVVDGDWYHVRLYFFPAKLPRPSQPEVIDGDEPAVQTAGRSWSLARLSTDAPGLMLALMALIGAGIGAACSQKKTRDKGAIVGGGFGLLVSLAMVSVDNAATSPKISEVAQALFITLTSAGLAGRAAGRVIKLSPQSRTAPSASATKTKPKTKKSRESDWIV